MVSEANIGHITNSIIFFAGMLRLKYDEPIRYSIRAIPVVAEPTNGKKEPKPIMRPCLGGCDKMFLTTIKNRICPRCKDKIESELEHFYMRNVEPD